MLKYLVEVGGGRFSLLSEVLSLLLDILYYCLFMYSVALVYYYRNNVLSDDVQLRQSPPHVRSQRPASVAPPPHPRGWGTKPSHIGDIM